MTDFAKESRDLAARDRSCGTSLEMYETFARRMHAAGLAEGLATAAEIIGSFVLLDEGDIALRENFMAAILSASPPALKEGP